MKDRLTALKAKAEQARDSHDLARAQFQVDGDRRSHIGDP